MTKTKPKRASSHPWFSWFQRGEFVLTRGKHFFGRTDSMAQQIRNAASRWNLKAHLTISLEGDKIGVIVSRRDYESLEAKQRRFHAK